MSYVASNLLKDEKIIYMGIIHWVIYIQGLVVMIIGIAVRTEIITPALIAFGLLLLISSFIRQVSTELVITNKRTIYKVGLISRTVIEINHNKLESVNIRQSIPGRLFGYGTIVVCGTGSGASYIAYLSKPNVFKYELQSIVA